MGYNYSNLSPIEFEALCKDVMSRLLSVKFHRFGSGKDGGIDLCNEKQEIVVQVKHYISTPYSGLKSSLKKEIQKVKKSQPKQYYICCSNKLTPKNKNDIYEMFKDYMNGIGNIITAIELDDFLDKPENKDILYSHYKLWLESTNVLTNIFNQDILIDSDELLDDVEENAKYFVKTRMYDKAIDLLNEKRVLMIVGNPGVGKTITSKMLVLYYATKGYKIRYTTDVTNLSSLKKSLSSSPEMKEIILLDDCFGQIYFDMKDTQCKELIPLIGFVNRKQSKLLIINSRVSIYNEAKNRSFELKNKMDDKLNIHILDVENITSIEKAKILYNYLYFSEISKDYFQIIIDNKLYQDIINHKNYNPRIIEYIVLSAKSKRVSPSEYAKLIKDSLEHPKEIWKTEYDNRLQEEDRIFLNTLYSLTNNMISENVLKECFNYRIKDKSDTTINHFNSSLNRLVDSMVKIIDRNETRMIGVFNPSVNDFLSKHIDDNTIEKEKIIENSRSILQLKKLLNSTDYNCKLHTLFDDKSILNYIFDDEFQKSAFITKTCIDYKIKDVEYQGYIKIYLYNIDDYEVAEEIIDALSIVDSLFEKEFCQFYELDKIICEISELSKILENLPLEYTIRLVNNVDWLFCENCRKDYLDLVKKVLNDKILDFCKNVSVDQFDINISKIVDGYFYDEEDGVYLDDRGAINDIEKKVREIAFGYLELISFELPEDICDDLCIDGYYNEIVVHDIEESMYRYLSDYKDEGFDEYMIEKWREQEDNLEIDHIFTTSLQGDN